MVNLTLPTDSAARKEYSIGRGCTAYFPAAIAGVARHSFKAGSKHTNGELVHKRWLSSDHDDCVERHLMDLRDMLAAVDRGVEDAYGIQAALLDEANALAWRALALSQILHEKFGGAPLAPAARLRDEDALEEDDDKICGNIADGWCCTKTRGHAGDHVAHNSVGQILKRWSVK